MAVNPPNAEQANMLNNLLKSLSPADTAKLNQILNDKEATNRVLSTPQAQELLKKADFPKSLVLNNSASEFQAFLQKRKRR